MRQTQNNISSPNISIPETLITFVEGFSAESEEESQILFEQAIESISGNSEHAKRDLKMGLSLFKIINPQDDIEKVWCAQFIVGHLLGMEKLTLPSPRDKRIGVKLLKAAEDAIERINKKRNGSHLNVAINDLLSKRSNECQ